MSVELFIGNLSNDKSSDDLRALSGEAAAVESCQLVTDRDTGRSKGFAFIERDSVPKAGFKNSAGYSERR